MCRCQQAPRGASGRRPSPCRRGEGSVPGPFAVPAGSVAVAAVTCVRDGLDDLDGRVEEDLGPGAVRLGDVDLIGGAGVLGAVLGGGVLDGGAGHRVLGGGGGLREVISGQSLLIGVAAVAVAMAAA